MTSLPARVLFAVLVVAIAAIGAPAIVGTPPSALADTPSTTAAPTGATTTTPVDTSAPAITDPAVATSPSVTTSGGAGGTAATGVPGVPTAAPSSGQTATTAAETAIEAEVDADLNQFAAITSFQQAQLQEAAGEASYQQDVSALATDQQVEATAAAAQSQAQSDQADASRRLAELAVAAYTGEAPTTPGPVTASANANDVLLSLVFQGASEDVEDASQTLAERSAAQAHDVTQLASDRQAVSEEAGAVATDEQLVTTDASLAAAPGSPVASAATEGSGGAGSGSSVSASTGVTPASPSILGPSTLTATELAAWFAASGHTANTTVPMAQLAADYITAGEQTGVRADVAFAQSVIETGYFSFPAGGQLVSADNNFAGIGACDSCTSGWSFPDAQTGVSAQAELLERYASTTPVSTPLIPDAGVGGCCTTWMALSGKWATDPTYGTQILTIYQAMLAWALPARLVAAGL